MELLPELEKADREARFKAWLSNRCREAKPTQDDQARMIEVGEKIAVMKKSGIPRALFGQAAVTLNDWWKRQVSESHSAAGQKGGRPKAGHERSGRSKKIVEN